MGKRERRINQTQFEIRTLEDGKTIILEGYALKFGKRSEDFGGVDEILERGCLDKTDMSNVVALINHDPNYPLARNTVREGPGHLSLSVDDTGLRFSLIPTDTAYAKDLMTNMAAGVVNQCSLHSRWRKAAPTGHMKARKTCTIGQSSILRGYGMYRLSRRRHTRTPKRRLYSGQCRNRKKHTLIL